MRRLILLITALALLGLFALPAAAAEFDPGTMTFPLDGENRITDSFGDARVGHSHQGVDIMADKGVPVLSVGDGEVEWIGSSCCYLAIDHGGGWSSWYIHLNNDSESGGVYSDDGQGWGIADGIVRGSTVTAGQLIGWVGDSGNAEGSSPHLHFELRKDGKAIDPYDYLILAEAAWAGTFRDDDGSVHENNIEKIFAQQITVGCNPPTNNMFCPGRNITRGEMAAFIARALDLSAVSGTAPYNDVEGHLFALAVDKIETAEIGFGCAEDSFCPDRPLLRYEMAELLVRAFGYENPDGTDFFVDDNDNPYHESINKLAAAGITVGCNPPDNDQFCPDRELSRAEMATFFVRSLGL